MRGRVAGDQRWCALGGGSGADGGRHSARVRTSGAETGLYDGRETPRRPGLLPGPCAGGMGTSDLRRLQRDVQRHGLVPGATRLRGPAGRAHGALHRLGCTPRGDSSGLRGVQQPSVGPRTDRRAGDDVGHVPAGIDPRLRTCPPTVAARAVGLRGLPARRHDDESPAPARRRGDSADVPLAAPADRPRNAGPATRGRPVQPSGACPRRGRGRRRGCARWRSG